MEARMRKCFLTLVLVGFGIAVQQQWTEAQQAEAGKAKAQQAEAGKGHTMFTPSTLSWGPAPASLPKGAQLAVLEGDPAKAGPFTMRIKVPDGFKIPPHWHPADEHLTVVQGTFVVGLGEKFDQAAGREMPTGSFALMPTGTRHFAWAKGETIVQVHGTGPWGITYVNPADDPRKSTSQQN
jgi:quercetin dioxygenase-like cupin family protein